jgi:hypothetical protein
VLRNNKYNIKRDQTRDPTYAAAVGVADPDWGETPPAFVALAQGADVGAEELRIYLRERIASYKGQALARNLLPW